jgi:hypothetical protein
MRTPARLILLERIDNKVGLSKMMALALMSTSSMKRIAWAWWECVKGPRCSQVR